VSAAQSTTDLAHAEEITEDPYGQRKWATDMVQLSGKNRSINEFSVTRLNDPADIPQHNLVMLHGYGAGLAFFYKNFEALSRRPGWRLFALDMPGMGRSSRPPFKISAKDREGKIEEAESWFVDALEEWRIKRRLERFTLLGHSLGGYMATAYALKYPGRLEKLILASPVGIPEDPYAMASELPDSESSSTQQAVEVDANVGAAPLPSSEDGNNANMLPARSSQEKHRPEEQQPTRRPYPKWLVYLWDANVSPFSFVRWAGPLGPRLVSGWTSRRFSHLPAGEAQALHDYSYSLFRQRGSGEYALAYVLAPGAFARSPLIRRIGQVGRGFVPESTPGVDFSKLSSRTETVNGVLGRRELGLPVTLMYGEHDWMDVKGGRAAVKKLDEARKAATASMSQEDASKDRGSAKVSVLREAGHHVYLDGYDEFNEMMQRELEQVEKLDRK
jgi:cardiolipin-specific phospholipase